jgi:histone deacetylase complex subunit SAP30
MANGNGEDAEELQGLSRSSRRQPRVDLSKLEVPTLKRYRSTFNLGGSAVVDSKEELVPAVARHFAQQVVDEDDILLNFAFSLKKQYLAKNGLLPKNKAKGAKGKSSGKGRK